MTNDTTRSDRSFLSGYVSGILSIAVSLTAALMIPGIVLTPTNIIEALVLLSFGFATYILIRMLKERRRLAGTGPK